MSCSLQYMHILYHAQLFSPFEGFLIVLDIFENLRQNLNNGTETSNIVYRILTLLQILRKQKSGSVQQPRWTFCIRRHNIRPSTKYLSRRLVRRMILVVMRLLCSLLPIVILFIPTLRLLPVNHE